MFSLVSWMKDRYHAIIDWLFPDRRCGALRPTTEPHQAPVPSDTTVWRGDHPSPYCLLPKAELPIILEQRTLSSKVLEQEIHTMICEDDRQVIYTKLEGAFPLVISVPPGVKIPRMA